MPQIRALRLFCEQNKIENWELFADENQSGTKSSRPALDRMMKAVESGEIETVVVFAFSRYARSVSHMLKGLETSAQKKEYLARKAAEAKKRQEELAAKQAQMLQVEAETQVQLPPEVVAKITATQSAAVETESPTPPPNQEPLASV